MGFIGLEPEGPMGGGRERVEEAQERLGGVGWQRPDVLGREPQELGEVEQPPGFLGDGLEMVG
ncbi:MAG: hypothetical protein ACREJF_06645, partial [Candidatus Methylomirabilales bacterium]